jgi:hypothetical protein
MTRRGGLALSICLVLVGLLGLATPPKDEFAVHTDVPVGQWGTNDEYAVRILDVTLTRRAEPAPDAGGRPIEAPRGAVLVVVTLEYRAVTEEVRLVSLSRFVDGKGRTSRALIQGDIPETGPGFIGTGQVVFVVDEATLPGSTLVFPSRSQLFTGMVLDTVRVDPGLGQQPGVTPNLVLGEPRVTVAP